LELLVKSTTLIQATWRGKVRRKMYEAICLFTRHVQSLLRSKQARADLMRHRSQQSAVRIQALARKSQARKKYTDVLRKVVLIQSARRAVLARRYAKEFRKDSSAARLQALVRARKEQKIYSALRSSILVAQQRWRMHYAKSQMKKLKQEAKEVGALMAKAQKQQEQAMELRKKNEEAEAHELQLSSEKKSLHAKVKLLEDSLSQMKTQLEDSKEQAAETVKLAADHSKTVVEAAQMETLNEQLATKDADLAKLLEDLAALKETFSKQEAALQSAEANYQQLLRSTAMQSVGGSGVSAGPPNPALANRAQRSGSTRNVFIQLVGDPGVGKTSLLGALVQEHDPAQLGKFEEQKSNLMSHHQIQIGERLLKFLDCSGNERAAHLVKEWFSRTQWVFVIYSLTDPKSYEKAMGLMADARQAGSGVVLFGNRFDVKDGNEVKVNMSEAMDKATQAGAYAVEGISLNDAVRWVASQSEQSEGGPGAEPSKADADGMGSPDGKGKSSISAAIDSVKSWFGGAGERGGKANAGVLLPSLKGTKAMKQARAQAADVNADLRPVQELQDSESAVTCICFGQERLHRT
ncbi:unnamed protein product, partial [Polarella glacialis]